MTRNDIGRRRFAVGVGAGAVALVGCHGESDACRGEIITPGEDLMGEHGIVRRIMVIWNEMEPRLRRGDTIDPQPLASSVDALQWFIERYHERTEEDEVFPRLERAGREVELVRTLRHQHEVGRALSRDLASLLGRGLDETTRAPIADRLAAHSRMYAAHASREDTVIFPTLREIVGDDWVHLGREFDEREDHVIGAGGLDRALAQVEAVERAYGIEALESFTPSIA